MKRFWKINIFTGFLALFSGLLTTNANPGIRLRFTDKGLMLGECLLVLNCFLYILLPVTVGAQTHSINNSVASVSSIVEQKGLRFYIFFIITFRITQSWVQFRNQSNASANFSFTCNARVCGNCLREQNSMKRKTFITEFMTPSTSKMSL